MKRPACLPELTELLSALCDDTISEAQFKRLDELLASDAGARAHYAVYMDMHCGLSRRWGLSESVSPARIQAELPARPVWRRWLSVVMSAAALVAITSILTLLIARTPEQSESRSVSPELVGAPTPAIELTSDSVAMLASEIDAVWANDSALRSAGAPLSPGWMRLKSGLAVIQFYSGATVILQGPAEFRVLSTGEAFCQSGRLRAEVPPQAQGFQIGSPHVMVTDLGTEFGLEVTEDHAEVHVLKGEVELTKAQVAVAKMKEGEAVSIRRDGYVRRFAAREDAFVKTQEVAARAADSASERTRQWIALSEKFNADPFLQVHFDFEKLGGGARTLTNLAGHSSGSNGLIVGCAVAEGRWPGKGALEFRNRNDRVRMVVPGQYQALTLSMWVRVDSLDHLFSSLLMVDAYNEGAFHWQITNTGKVVLGVAGAKSGVGSGNVDYPSPEVITPDRLGRWMHLALVFDAEAGEVKHFLDGSLIQQSKLRYKHALQIGNCELGNWNPGSHVTKFPFRYLSGRMDQFSIHSRAFTDSEVAQLHALGSARTPVLKK